MLRKFFLWKRKLNQFFKFVKNNYKDWINGEILHCFLIILSKKVLPLIDEGKPTYLIIIDNLRYDQWKIIEPTIVKDFDLVRDEMYYSILPTATQYSRNSIFSGFYLLKLRKDFLINGKTMKMRRKKYVWGRFLYWSITKVGKKIPNTPILRLQILILEEK